jgi:hypothetical protein
MSALMEREEYGIHDWLDSVERMVNRISFAISDDLESAVSGIRREPHPLGRHSANDRIMDLLNFVISAQYRDIRQALALTVRPQSS